MFKPRRSSDRMGSVPCTSDVSPDTPASQPGTTGGPARQGSGSGADTAGPPAAHHRIFGHGGLWPSAGARVADRAGRAAEAILRYIFGDDIFISYARADASSYAAGLASELAGLGLSCRLDQWGTPPGQRLPAALLRALRRSMMLVVIGSKGAASSANVWEEINEFLPTGRTIIPIDVDGSLRDAPWWPLIAGVAVSIGTAYTGDSLTTGMPSTSVVSRIKNACVFTRRDRRLRNVAAWTIATTLTIALAGVVAGWVALDRSAEAVRQGKLAEKSKEKVGLAEKAVRDEERRRQEAEEKTKETRRRLVGEQRKADEAEWRRKVAERLERRAMLHAQAQAAMTQGDALRGFLLARKSLTMSLQDTELGDSPSSRLVLAEAVNAGLPVVFPLSNSVQQVRVHNGRGDVAAIGAIDRPGAEPERLLALWKPDGSRPRTARGLFTAVAFTPDGENVVASKIILGENKRYGAAFRVELQWFSPDLKLVKRFVLPAIASKHRNIKVSLHLYEVQDLRFTKDGTKLALAGAAVYGEDLISFHRGIAWLDPATSDFEGFVEEDAPRYDLGDVRERVCLADNRSSPQMLFFSGNEMIFLKVGSRDSTFAIPHTGRIAAVCASPSGNRYAAVGPGNEVTSATRQRDNGWSGIRYVLPDEERGDLAVLLDDDHLAIARPDGAISVVRIAGGASDGKPPVSGGSNVRLARSDALYLRGHAAAVTVLEASADGRWLASADAVGVVRAWNISGPDERVFSAGAGRVSSLQFNGNGQWLIGGARDGMVRFWRVEDGFNLCLAGGSTRRANRDYLGESDSFSSQWLMMMLDRTKAGLTGFARWTPDGRHLVTQTYDGVVSVYDARFRLLKRLNVDDFVKIEISGDSRWIIGQCNREKIGGDNRHNPPEGFDLWEIDGGRRLSVDSTVRKAGALVSPRGEWAEIASGDRLVLHRVEDGVDGQVLAGGRFSPDGRWFATLRDGKVRVWDVRKPGESLKSFDAPPGYSFLAADSEEQWMAFSPAGNFLATTVRGKEGVSVDLVSLDGPGRRVISDPNLVYLPLFSPDGKWAAALSRDNGFVLWPTNGGPPRVFLGHTHSLEAIAFSPDSRWVATGGSDRTIRVWSVETGDVSITRTFSTVTDVAFNHDGDRIAIASGQSVYIRFVGTGPLPSLLKETSELTNATPTFTGTSIKVDYPDNPPYFSGVDLSQPTVERREISAGPEFKVACWYRFIKGKDFRGSHHGDFHYQVYDLRKGEYNEEDVTRWERELRTRHTGYSSQVISVYLGKETGGTEQKKLDAAIDRVRKRIVE
jgi:WD40 repeat protein